MKLITDGKKLNGAAMPGIVTAFQKAVVGKRIVKAGYAQQMNDEQEVWPCLWIHSFSFRCVLTRLCGATFSAVATIV